MDAKNPPSLVMEVTKQLLPDECLGDLQFLFSSLS